MCAAFLIIMYRAPCCIIEFTCSNIIKLTYDPSKIYHLFVCSNNFPPASSFSKQLFGIFRKDTGRFLVCNLLIIILTAFDMFVLLVFMNARRVSLGSAKSERASSSPAAAHYRAPLSRTVML